MKARERWTLRAWSACLVLASAMLMGCPGRQGVVGTMEVRLTCGGASARTVLPTVLADTYVVTLSGPVPIDPVEVTTTAFSLEVAAGTWDLTVQALLAGSVVASGGAEDVVVAHSETTAVDIELLPAHTGDGTIDISVAWPTSVGVDSGILEAKLDSSPIDGAYLTSTSTSLHYLQQVAAGIYTFQLSLPTGGSHATVITECVYVFANLSSVLTLTLTESDFSVPPAAPTGVAATPGTDTITVSWKDNSHVETAYVVQRTMTSGDYSAPLIVELAANSAQYIDADVAVDVTYYYRVKAKNSFGESPASAEVACRTGGTLSITISIVSPTDATISFSIPQDYVAGTAEALEVSVMESFDAYQWWLDGVEAATGQTVAVDCSLLEPGVHHLTVIVTDIVGEDGLQYSATRRFRVEN